MFSECQVLIFSKNSKVNPCKAEKGSHWMLCSIHIQSFYFIWGFFSIKFIFKFILHTNCSLPVHISLNELQYSFVCPVSVSVGLFSLSYGGLWLKQSLRSSWEEPFGEYATAINARRAVGCWSCWTRVPQCSLRTGVTASKGYLKVNTEVVHHCADTLFPWEAETCGLLCMPCKCM